MISNIFDKQEVILPRYRHRYEVNPDYIKVIEEKGMIFTGIDETEKRMEILEINDHPYFVGV